MKSEPDFQSPTDDDDENVCIESSGNIFADMQMTNPEERLAKAELSIQIENLIDAKKLRRRQAAALMGITQSNLSDIVRGRLQDFTPDRLYACLNALRQDARVKANANAGQTVSFPHSAKAGYFGKLYEIGKSDEAQFWSRKQIPQDQWGWLQQPKVNKSKHIGTASTKRSFTKSF